MLYIRPKAIVTPHRWLEDGAVLIEDDHIIAVGKASEVRCPPEAEMLPADDLLLAPGYIDLQINGAFGCDFTANPSTIWEVGTQLPRCGVTAFLPTIITSPKETVATAQEVLCQGPPTGYKGAMPLGLHLEGPFLNPEKRGAHNPAYLRAPDQTDIRDWSADRGVRLVTLAPELSGAPDLIRVLRSRGVVVSAGHSLATLEQAVVGIEAGITYGTHLFNAMPPLAHRDPGLVGALLADRRVTVGVIADGVHLHPNLINLVHRAKGPEQVNLVTDAIAAFGMPPGTYRLGNSDVISNGKEVRIANGTLAGSALSLDQAVRNFSEFTGCRLSEAIQTVTSVSASALGLGESSGRVAPGYRDNLTLLDSDLRVLATIVAGEVVYSNV